MVVEHHIMKWKINEAMIYPSRISLDSNNLQLDPWEVGTPWLEKEKKETIRIPHLTRVTGCEIKTLPDIGEFICMTPGVGFSNECGWLAPTDGSRDSKVQMWVGALPWLSIWFRWGEHQLLDGWFKIGGNFGLNMHVSCMSLLMVSKNWESWLAKTFWLNVSSRPSLRKSLS